MVTSLLVLISLTIAWAQRGPSASKGNENSGSCFGFTASLNVSTAEVIDEDDRVSYQPRKAPGKFFGRLVSVMGDHYLICTGTLVGMDLVSTAGHCVLDEQGEWLPGLKTMRFEAQYYDGHMGGLSRLVSVTANRQQDWAILRLKEPLGRKLGFAGVCAMPDSYFWTYPVVSLVGFSGDYLESEVAGAHHGCRARGIAHIHEQGYVGDFIRHDCDMSSGSSGGALLQQIEGKWYVLGTNIFDVTQRNGPRTVENFASPARYYHSVIERLGNASTNGHICDGSSSECFHVHVAT
eukprot:TRINITY_DN111299_c0_g1_i1.p1 TRINITY_DN111299_c0_g1~~TRINITY_DN111299_c0_g1_i1.p1  ORF type:complete len:293 (-),score=34.19 TRINITY_DN111299_c0_g1_i1:15-893(-)